MAPRRVRIPPSPFVRLVNAGDGSIFLQYDDAHAQAAADFVSWIPEEFARQHNEGGPAQAPQQRFAGTNPLTVNPPRVAHGQNAPMNAPRRQALPVNVRPPPNPHQGIAAPNHGPSGQGHNPTGVAAMPQPQLFRPPPPPTNMGPNVGVPYGSQPEHYVDDKLPDGVAPVEQTYPDGSPVVADAQPPQVVGSVGVAQVPADQAIQGTPPAPPQVQPAAPQATPGQVVVRRQAAPPITSGARRVKYDPRAPQRSNVPVKGFDGDVNGIVLERGPNGQTIPKKSGPIRVLPQPGPIPPPPPPKMPPRPAPVLYTADGKLWTGGAAAPQFAPPTAMPSDRDPTRPPFVPSAPAATPAPVTESFTEEHKSETIPAAPPEGGE